MKTAVVLLMLSLQSIANASGLVRCEDASGITFRNDGECPGAARQTKPSQSEKHTAASTQPQQSAFTLEQLKANCPNELAAFANKAGSIEMGYNFRLAMIKAKCQSPSMQCYQQFDALSRIDYYRSESGTLGTAKKRASALAAACNVTLDLPQSTRQVCRPVGNTLVCQ